MYTAIGKPSKPFSQPRAASTIALSAVAIWPVTVRIPTACSIGPVPTCTPSSAAITTAPAVAWKISSGSIPSHGRPRVWTIAHLSPSNFEYLRELPAGPVRVNGFQLIHGSPLDEDEYVISATDARNVFDYLEANVTFFGHTHLQCGYAHVDGYFQIMRPLDPFLGEVWHRLDPDGIYLINAGSVGQPRDGDSACRVCPFRQRSTLEVVQRRVPYDYETTRRKIEAAGLPDVLGSRLAIGVVARALPRWLLRRLTLDASLTCCN